MSYYIHQPHADIYYFCNDGPLRKPLLLYDDIERYINTHGLNGYIIYIQSILKDIINVIQSIKTYPTKAFLSYKMGDRITQYHHFTIQVDYYWKRYIQPFITNSNSMPLVWYTIDNHVTLAPIIRKILESHITDMKQFWNQLISTLQNIMPITHKSEIFIKEDIEAIKNFIQEADRKYKRQQIIRWLYVETTRLRRV
jgi:hypothetical protein